MASFNLKRILKAIFSPSANSPQPIVIAIRTRTVTSVTPPIPADNPHSSYTTTSRGDLALEAAVPILGLIGAVANGIPVAGGPLKAVVNSLLLILDGFDVRTMTHWEARTLQKNRRNKIDIVCLQSRLERLRKIIDSRNYTSPSSTLTGQLAETESKLREALNMRKIRFQAVAELIQGCCKDIDYYLQEHQLATTLLTQSSMTLVIHLVDTMGHTHPIPISMTHTFEQFTQALKALYVRASDRGAFHHRYLEYNQFHLGINDSRKVIDIKDDNDLRELVRPGTTVVMSIVVAQKQYSFERLYLCPACDVAYLKSEDDDCPRGPWKYIEYRLDGKEAEIEKYTTPSQDDLEMIVNIHVTTCFNDNNSLDDKGIRGLRELAFLHDIMIRIKKFASGSGNLNEEEFLRLVYESECQERLVTTPKLIPASHPVISNPRSLHFTRNP
ncbi:hypothetical protein H0H92_001936 [Tricholoma furcatifolium]|nr:hypothetical protein H0H92_001936 [Tricholoma furcatifolium]